MSRALSIKLHFHSYHDRPDATAQLIPHNPEGGKKKPHPTVRRLGSGLGLIHTFSTPLRLKGEQFARVCSRRLPESPGLASAPRPVKCDLKLRRGHMAVVPHYEWHGMVSSPTTASLIPPSSGPCFCRAALSRFAKEFTFDSFVTCPFIPLLFVSDGRPDF